MLLFSVCIFFVLLVCMVSMIIGIWFYWCSLVSILWFFMFGRLMFRIIRLLLLVVSNVSLFWLVVVCWIIYF